MLINFLLWSLLIIGLLCFLGFCHFCYQFKRTIWKCPVCGFIRPHKDTSKYCKRGPYAIQRIVTMERCDSSQEECVNSDMALINRKWRWILSRPFAWTWTPLALFTNQVVDLIKTFSKPGGG
jgi:hypothetical protein